MLTDLQIRGFRSLRTLSLHGLSRVNLIVGANNAGKTSVLEAAEMLLSGEPRVFWRVPGRRMESMPHAESSDRMTRPEWDIRHLFHGHSIAPGSHFSITGNNDRIQSLHCEITAAFSTAEFDQETLDLPDMESGSALAVKLTGSHFDKDVQLMLSAEGGLRREIRPIFNPKPLPRVMMLSIGEDSRAFLGATWDKIVLTPEEQHVIEALRIIEPGIERIAPLTNSRGGFLVKMAGIDQPFPLGSMGDGVRYLLTLSMAMAHVAGGYLLVDEIDTGLHFSAMARMWTLVIENAKRLGVQILATTHSFDCLRALASVCGNKPSLLGEIAVHRVEKNAEKAIAYSGEELESAIQQELEIR